MPPRVVAIIAAYNEERFIGGCLEHLFANGVEAYLCDNESTDRTVEIAKSYLGGGLVGIETLPRDGTYRWTQILARKEQLAAELDADWFLHLDADEIPQSSRPGQTLAEAIAEADAAGYNAVEFSELTFVATREAPDHDHPGFRNTMRWYYPFAPRALHLVRAWKVEDRAAEADERVRIALACGVEALGEQAIADDSFQLPRRPAKLARIRRRPGKRRAAFQHSEAGGEQTVHGRLFREAARHHQIVAVETGDVLAARMGEPEVQRGGMP